MGSIMKREMDLHCICNMQHGLEELLEGQQIIYSVNEIQRISTGCSQSQCFQQHICTSLLEHAGKQLAEVCDNETMSILWQHFVNLCMLLCLQESASELQSRWYYQSSLSTLYILHKFFSPLYCEHTQLHLYLL